MCHLRAERVICLGYLPVRTRCLPTPELPAARRGSAAVEHVVAEILHLEDRDIGPALDRLRQVRLGDLADDDVMVALLDDAGDLALDCSERRVEDRRAVAAFVDGLAGKLAV